MAGHPALTRTMLVRPQPSEHDGESDAGFAARLWIERAQVRLLPLQPPSAIIRCREFCYTKVMPNPTVDRPARTGVVSSACGCSTDHDQRLVLKCERHSRVLDDVPPGYRWKRMTDHIAAVRVWTILVEECGADPSASAALDFYRHWPECREYRFAGALGFGGKVWDNAGRVYVSFYFEDYTPERQAAKEVANIRLAHLVDELRR